MDTGIHLESLPDIGRNEKAFLKNSSVSSSCEVRTHIQFSSQQSSDESESGTLHFESGHASVASRAFQ